MNKRHVWHSSHRTVLMKVVAETISRLKKSADPKMSNNAQHNVRYKNVSHTVLY